jgi:hypothetical protein
MKNLSRQKQNTATAGRKSRFSGPVKFSFILPPDLAEVFIDAAEAESARVEQAAAMGAAVWAEATCDAHKIHRPFPKGAQQRAYDANEDDAPKGILAGFSAIVDGQTLADAKALATAQGVTLDELVIRGLGRIAAGETVPA